MRYPSERWWSAYATIYDALWNGALTDSLADAVVAHAGPPHGRTVDVGCGTGLVSRRLVEAGHNVLCVDSNLEMLRRLQRRIPGAWAVAGSIDHLPLPPECAEIVVSTNVLHVHPCPHRAIAKMMELLAPGGQLLCSWPSDDAGPQRIASAEHRRGLAGLAIAARAAGRIAAAVTAPRSLSRTGSESIRSAFLNLADHGRYDIAWVDLPDAVQTLVVVRRT